MRKKKEEFLAEHQNVDMNDAFFNAHLNAIDPFRIVELELFTGIKERINMVVEDAINT